MAPSAHAGAALVRLPLHPAPASLLKQSFGRAGAKSLSLRGTKGSDDFRALVSEKSAEPSPGKREGWEGLGREVSNEEEEAQMQGGESASWSFLNQIGVEVMEVVGLGFTVWFSSRYLIFKENRDELITRISSMKKQILGSRED